jgi:hypothetical protein
MISFKIDVNRAFQICIKTLSLELNAKTIANTTLDEFAEHLKKGRDNCCRY